MRIALVFTILIGLNINLFSQTSFGIYSGIDYGNLFDYSSDNTYSSDYTFKSGTDVGAFLEFPNDSTSTIRYGLAYQFLNSELEVSESGSKSIFYRNLSFKYQQVQLSASYLFNIINKKTWNSQFEFGLAGSYLFNTISEGIGTDYIYKTVLDSNNNPIQVLTIDNWTKKESNSSDLNNFNFGVIVGFEINQVINRKLDLFFLNRNHIILTDILSSNKYRYTSILSISGYLGLRIKIAK
jgi:hypothetical protein